MKITSERFTNRIKRENGTLEYVPPGTEFDLPDAKAVVKIAAGRAELASYDRVDALIETDSNQVKDDSKDPDPNPASTQTPNPVNLDPPAGQNAEEAEKIEAAMLEIDLDDPENVLEDGRPKVEALTKALGRQATADERNAAWESLKGDGAKSGD